MKKKTFIILSILSAFAMTACGVNIESSSQAPESSSIPSSSQQASSSSVASSSQQASSSVDPNADKRVTEAVFTSEITEFGMFGLDRKVTVNGTSTDLEGDNYTIYLTTKFDNGKVSIKQETKAKADGTVVDTFETAFLLEEDAEDGKIYYKERYAQNGQGEWQKNTTKAEFDITAMYDIGMVPDKYVFSSFTFDEETGTYKCPSIQAQIYGDDYLVENIEISFQNNKVMKISNKFTSQDADHPGSYNMVSVFSDHGNTTVTLPDVPDNPQPSQSEQISALFLDIGEQVSYIAASKDRPEKKGLMQDMDERNKIQAFASPAVLLYLIGKLYEVDGFDCYDKVVGFREVFDFYMDTEPTVFDISVDVMIKIDKDNGRIQLYANQNMITEASSTYATICIDTEYDFDKGEASSFKIYCNAITQTAMFNVEGLAYYEYINGVAKELDTSVQDEVYDAKHAEYTTIVAEFNTKCESKTTADATLAHTYGEAFIAAQNFTNQVIDQDLPITFHEE